MGIFNSTRRAIGAHTTLNTTSIETSRYPAAHAPRGSALLAHMIAGVACLAGVIGVAGQANADVVYFNDFEAEAFGTEWSAVAIETTPVLARSFLGRFGNENVSLSISDLPTHDTIRISFDLYIIGSWDGNTIPGPDAWGIAVAGGPTLLHTTFCVSGPTSTRTQNYPDWIGGDSHAQRTGAAESNTMGYTWSNVFLPIPVQTDAMWQLSFEVPHTAAGITFNFFASGLQPIDDEAWGLDNVRVEAVPTPGALVFAGIGGLVALRRRRR